MIWSLETVAKERVRDLHREAAHRRLTAHASSRRGSIVRGPWWRGLMGLATLRALRAVRPAL